MMYNVYGDIVNVSISITCKDGMSKHRFSVVLTVFHVGINIAGITIFVKKFSCMVIEPIIHY